MLIPIELVMVVSLVSGTLALAMTTLAWSLGEYPTGKRYVLQVRAEGISWVFISVFLWSVFSIAWRA